MKSLRIIFFLLLVSCAALAQTKGGVENPRGKYMGLPNSSTMGKMMDSKMDANANIPFNYKGYSDDQLEDLNKAMKEREWNSEESAWARACELDTRQAYEKYIGAYPNGIHTYEANRRLINSKITETLDNAHNALPNIKQTEYDDNSLTSTIVIENNTGYPLTVYYSGSDIKSIIIPVNGKSTFTVENGEYKLAATVPPAYIRPFAGKTEFCGGRYEMGFWVVSR